ncbi:MAG: hypothetical protein JSW65_02620, partial [Candidatus Bipolaricaulota bacterium]
RYDHHWIWTHCSTPDHDRQEATARYLLHRDPSTGRTLQIRGDQRMTDAFPAVVGRVPKAPKCMDSIEGWGVLVM